MHAHVNRTKMCTYLSKQRGHFSSHNQRLPLPVSSEMKYCNQPTQSVWLQKTDK